MHANFRGSLWRRWDLHLHTPNTQLSDAYVSGIENAWDVYLDILQASPVSVFGVTDYFSCKNYFAMLEKYKIRFPEGKKVFFPNIEFRLTETVSKDNKNIHSHVIFDNDLANCSRAQIEGFLSKLDTHISDATGTKVSCNDLASNSAISSATVSIENLKAALKKQFGNKKPYLIITAANNDGLKEVDTKSLRKTTMSDELDKSSHAFFGNAKNTPWFLKNDRYENTDIPSSPKPVFSGSDAHSFDDLERLSGDVTNFPACWVKAEPTFRGLLQTLFEPQARVFIGEQPPVLERITSEATKMISHLKINQVSGYSESNGVWFKDVEIPLNPELTAIIGNKGSGKSAIADIIGLLGETRNEEHFSFLSNKNGNKKFRKSGYAENFEAELHWLEGSSDTKNLNDSVSQTNPEKVKYLPQNFFEKLTNDLEIRSFRDQIENVVFSHVEETDRMETDTFKELEEFKTAQSKKDISGLKVQLREVNLKLVDLEAKHEPAYLLSLRQQLKLNQESLDSLGKSLSEIAEVNKPSEEDDAQKEINETIRSWTQWAQSSETLREATIAKVASLKAKFQRLSSLFKGLEALQSHIAQNKQDLKPLCEELGFDIEQILTSKIDFSEINKQGRELKAEYEALEIDNEAVINTSTDLDSVTTIPDLFAASSFIQEQIKLFKDQLSLPHKRYQSYLQSIQRIQKQMSDIRGNPEDPAHGTIEFIKARMAYVENDLLPAIDALKLERKDFSKKIFTAKKLVLDFYEDLQKSVETRLSDVSSDEFAVSIQASFVPKSSFIQSFLLFVNQQKKGPFRLEVEGKNKLREMAEDVNWNDFESIYSCMEAILDLMSSKDEWSIDNQVDRKKEFYDFVYELEYFEAKYELLLGGKRLDQLSPGEKGLLLLVFYLHLDKDKTPLVIDQPEDNLDNDSIFQVLAHCIRSAKKNRQVILVTHNPNLAVGADAEQILYVKLDKAKHNTFTYASGAIETEKMNAKVIQVLEGSRPAFIQRRLKYQIL
jgi:predicted ATPase